MTDREMNDALARLLPLAPDPQRAIATGRRGVAAVRRRTVRRARAAEVRTAVLRAAAPVMVGVLCALYAAALLGTTLELAWAGLR